MQTPLPCPFCGKKVDLADDDTLHPDGIYWRYDAELEMKTYHRHKERLPTDNACYVLNCSEVYGGCGAEMSGDSKGEVLAAWNKRA